LHNSLICNVGFLAIPVVELDVTPLSARVPTGRGTAGIVGLMVHGCGRLVTQRLDDDALVAAAERQEQPVHPAFRFVVPVEAQARQQLLDVHRDVCDRRRTRAVGGVIGPLSGEPGFDGSGHLPDRVGGLLEQTMGDLVVELVGQRLKRPAPRSKEYDLLTQMAIELLRQLEGRDFERIRS